MKQGRQQPMPKRRAADEATGEMRSAVTTREPRVDAGKMHEVLCKLLADDEDRRQVGRHHVTQPYS